MADEGLTKHEFKNKYGFFPHEEACICGWRRADHTIWNTDKTFKKNCSSTTFQGTGKKC
jgi:hypothetical protein